MLIERLPDERLDNRLTADVEVSRSLIQFLQHGDSDVQVGLCPTISVGRRPDP
jgi:hypothetical protein